MSIILNTKDQKLLVELDENARRSNAEIGKRIGLSKETVKYRVDQLKENKVIIRFHTIINYFKVGITKHKLYLRLKNTNKKNLELIINYLYKNPKNEWIVHTTGRWDLIIGFLVNNTNELDDQIQNLLDEFGENILEKTITTTLVLTHVQRINDSKGKKTHEVIIHTSKDPKEEIDTLDEKILQILANNARIPSTVLAQMTKSTPRVIGYRIKELEKKKIILGYKAHIEPQAIGKLSCKAIIQLKQAKRKETEEFVKATVALNGAVWPQRVLGNWDYEIDFEVANYNEFQERISEIKERFPNTINNIEFCITDKEYKLSIYPNAHKEI
jgi:Lrp/AsnC family transcriptional regulator, leucine-responsive regulatory protein